jgi:hypothetical protein
LHLLEVADLHLMQQPRSDEARERAERIEQVRFHRAHVIELVYFSILAAVALGLGSFFVDPDWAWFLRGMIVGLVLTFLYVWIRVTHQSFARRGY